MSELTLPERFEGLEMVKGVRLPARLDFTYTAGQATTRFLNHVTDKRLVGQRCPSCSKVYVPPRGACPTCGVATEEEVELGDTGTVTSFCVVTVAFYGQAMELPYVSALILPDGADIPLMHLIQEVPADEVRPGMRVEAVWVDEDADGKVPATLESIRYFRPTGEPDADPATYADHV
jgi:uncharacterized OB-fold protein